MIANFWGWLVLFLTYFLVFQFKNIENNKKIFYLLLLVVTLHHVVAVMNAYSATTLGASVDALRFHQGAIKILNHQSAWQFGSGPLFYRMFLAGNYFLFGSSYFLGAELSVLAFTCSCFIFIKICKEVGGITNLPILIILYGSLPSMVLFGSVTLRESWQILFLMLTIYFYLKNLFLAENNTNTFQPKVLVACIGAIFSSFIFSLFHEGFVMFSFVLAGMAVLYHLKNLTLNKLSAYNQVRYISIVLLIATACLALYVIKMNVDRTPELEAFHAISDGNAMTFINDYNLRVMQVDARTNYRGQPDVSSLLGIITSMGSNYLHYMFAPFPWQIKNAMDVYAFFEAILRALLLVCAFAVCWRCKGGFQEKIIYLLTVYILMSVMWSLGTVNYGTSIRHHIVSYWILILMFGIFLNSVASRSAFKIQFQENSTPC